MLRRFILNFILFIMSKLCEELPNGFVYLDEVNSNIISNLRYATEENFISENVRGYKANRVILTKQAALSLNEAWKIFDENGFNLVVYDAYRPTRAVDHFIEWSLNPNASQEKKSSYFPHIEHNTVFDKGYVAKKSGHSRGSTIDLTIIEKNKCIKPVNITKRILKDGREINFLDDNTVDMGSSFDLFDEASTTLSEVVSEQALKNRKFLLDTMIKCGFKNYEFEWWHYTLINEPFPNDYFNFEII